MTSSGPILYPSLKGLEQSNSSFVQVTHPIKETQRNLSSNHRNTVTKGERGNTSKIKRNELSAREENYLNKKRYTNEYAGSNENRKAGNEDIDKHETILKQPNRSYKMSTIDNVDFEQKPKTEKSKEKSQQFDNQGLGYKETTTTSESASSSIEEVREETSLVKPDPFLNLNRQPTIIINNTFINRSEAEQDEFLRKLTPAIFNKNKTVQSICDVIPSAIEQIKNDHLEVTENREVDNCKEKTYDNVQGIIFTDIEVTNDINTTTSSDKNIPIGSIITGILWIVLILFWFLLYLKVLNVYNPLPKVIPKPKPTNYELCLIFLRKFGKIIGRLWKF